MYKCLERTWQEIESYVNHDLKTSHLNFPSKIFINGSLTTSIRLLTIMYQVRILAHLRKGIAHDFLDIT